MKICFVDGRGMKFDILFTLAILFPGAPDDLLCLIAGLTPMSLKKFILILLLTKPFSLAIYSIGLTAILKLAYNNSIK